MLPLYILMLPFSGVIMWFYKSYKQSYSQVVLYYHGYGRLNALFRNV